MARPRGAGWTLGPRIPKTAGNLCTVPETPKSQEYGATAANTQAFSLTRVIGAVVSHLENISTAALSILDMKKQQKLA